MGYRIKTISELTGIPKSTLLAWERRYDLLSPHRGGNGYREYTDADLSILRELKRMIDQGYKVSEAISLVRVPQPGPAATVPEPAEGASAPEQLREALLSALLSFDRAAAVNLTEGLLFWSYSQLLDELYFPLLDEVGRGWAEGRITVVQEHFASDFIKSQMSAMLLRLGCGPEDGPHAVCAGYPGDTHEMGLLGLSVKLAMRGWRVTHLGANVPLDALAHFVRTQSPLMVCVSLVMPVSAAELGDFARQLAAARPARVRLVIGGSGLPEALPRVEGVEWARSSAQLFGHNGVDVLH